LPSINNTVYGLTGRKVSSVSLILLFFSGANKKKLKKIVSGDKTTSGDKTVSANKMVSANRMVSGDKTASADKIVSADK